MGALKRKQGSKDQSKLTNEQFLIFDKAIQDNNLKTAKEVKHLIETLFGVEYSLRSIDCTMKKLDHTYTKPYKIYAKMLKDAKEQLKTPTFISINRWGKACEKDGLDGLIPNFSGGKPSKLSEENKVQIKQILIEGETLTMTDAQRILKDDFGIEFSPLMFAIL